MIYDDVLRRGVSKKHLPGPRIFEFPSNTDYNEFISTVKPYFFKNDSAGDFCLANASGIPFEIDANTYGSCVNLSKVMVPQAN